MKHVIIGAGAAGITAAKTIRACDKIAEIMMIARDEHIHSRCMLHKYLSGERNEQSLSFVETDFIDKYNIIFITPGDVTDIDTHEKAVKLSGGLSVNYDKLLIATGADSFIPPIGEFRKAKNVFGLRNLSDAQAIAKMVRPRGKAVIVGSGLVGMDAAYALLEQKMDVTVVEMADRILPIQLDDAAGKEYQRLFEEAGCHFLLGRKAVNTVATKENVVNQLLLDDNTVIDCDFIIVAAGVRPASSCAAESGINAERSIEVNEYMETSMPDIYAAGDVTGLSGIWPNAMKQGRIAACNMCGQKTAYDDTYAMKNTINFFGLVTLSLGRGVVQEGDEVLICEDKNSYKRAIIRNNQLDSILLQGNINYAGAYQYLIKNKMKLGNENIFKISFADYYKVQKDGQYEYET